MFSSKAEFDKNLEKATSQVLLEADWDATLKVCDALRQQDVTAKYAFSSMRSKIHNRNPIVGLHVLQVLESCMKNCGNAIHEEVASREFMDDMKKLVTSPNDDVKKKVKELLQAWAHAFRNEAKLKIVVDTFNQLKNEGHLFPELKESDAMFMAQRAPVWVDGDRCFYCRTEFGVLQTRMHHCRHCGQAFCWKCSSKESVTQKFGFERPVRVCDECHGKLTGNSGDGKGGGSSSTGNSETESDATAECSPQSQVASFKQEAEWKQFSGGK